MEKRFRDYLRHLEKLDFDVISEEEIWEEREMLQLRLAEIHREMIRLLFPMIGALVSCSIFLAAGFGNMFIGNYICAAVMAVVFLWLFIRYRAFNGAVEQLCAFIDRLAVKEY